MRGVWVEPPKPTGVPPTAVPPSGVPPSSTGSRMVAGTLQDDVEPEAAVEVVLLRLACAATGMPSAMAGSPSEAV